MIDQIKDFFNTLHNHDKICIYGTGEVFENVIEIFEICQNEKKIKLNIIVYEPEKTNKIDNQYQIISNFDSVPTQDFTLIIADNETVFRSELINIIKINFKRIIDGYQMVHYCFQPLIYYQQPTQLNQNNEYKDHEKGLLIGNKANKKNDLNDKAFNHWKKASALNKIILLNYIGRSGSYYFTTLLEHHPELIVMPFKNLYNPKIQLTALKYCYPNAIDPNKLVNAFRIKKINYNQNMLKFRVGNENKLYPDGYEEKFLNAIEELIKIELREHNGILNESFLIKAQYYSHALALGLDLHFDKKIPYIVEQIHTIDSKVVMHYKDMFSKCIQLATVRNTVLSFSSLLCGMERMNKLKPAVVLKLLDTAIKNPIIAQDEIAKLSVLIRIEDLNLRPRYILEKLCSYIQIEWNDSLMKNTLNGKIFYDSYEFKEGTPLNTTGPRIDGIIKNYQDYLSSFDKFRLEALFYHVMKRFGYDVHNFRDKEILMQLFKQPFRFENRVVYRSNTEQEFFRKTMEERCIKYLTNVIDNPQPRYLKLINIIE